MSRFYVGQRIKKVRGVEAIGITGVVSGQPVASNNAQHGCDITVVADISVPSREGPIIEAGEVGATWSYLWEPILPEGHQPAELTVHELLPFLKATADA